MLWRQGDVLIETAPSLPAGATVLPHVVLAEGEITGHSHRVETAGTARLYSHQGQMYLQVFGDEAAVVHEEHGTVRLPHGLYRVWRQRGYAPQVRISRSAGGVTTVLNTADIRWVQD